MTTPINNNTRTHTHAWTCSKRKKNNDDDDNNDDNNDDDDMTISATDLSKMSHKKNHYKLLNFGECPKL